MNKKLLGISGLKGSFSEEAGLLYLKSTSIRAELTYLVDMEGVLAAVESGTVDLGILPIVNLLGGIVKPAFKAMGKHAFEFVDDLWLEVNQCLMTLPNLAPDNIAQIVSHPQGLAQCKKYLQAHFKSADQIEWIDTAKAAADLSAGILLANSAVIAPAHASECYNLKIIAKNIQDTTPNLTAFIIIKKR